MTAPRFCGSQATHTCSWSTPCPTRVYKTWNAKDGGDGKWYCRSHLRRLIGELPMDLPIAPRKTWKSAHSRRIVSASVTMIRPETDAFFKRMAKIRARTVAEVIAEILDGYASERIMEPSLEHLKADPWARNYEVLDAQAV